MGRKIIPVSSHYNSRIGLIQHIRKNLVAFYSHLIKVPFPLHQIIFYLFFSISHETPKGVMSYVSKLSRNINCQWSRRDSPDTQNDCNKASSTLFFQEDRKGISYLKKICWRLHIKGALQIQNEQEKARSFYGKEYKNDQGFIFTWDDGTLYDPDYISKPFKKAVKTNLSV